LCVKLRNSVQRAAYQHTIFYIDTNTTSQWANLNKYESNPDCYTADVHNIYGSWGTYFLFRWAKVSLSGERENLKQVRASGMLVQTTADTVVATEVSFAAPP